MSSRCIVCKGSGRTGRLLFAGQKPCWRCGGDGEMEDLGDVARDIRFAYQDLADEWMDRHDPDLDWSPDFEAGYEVPGDAAEKWANGPGLDWKDDL